MSELRIGLVAEGSTDAIIIKAALAALLLPRPFVLTLLQPEIPSGPMGAGWGGVLRWCMEFAGRGSKQLEDDPTLPGFDLFVLHIDADVAQMDYANVSRDIQQKAGENGWPALPCPAPCPPPSAGVDEMRCRLLAWAKLPAPGPRTILCVPSKAVEAWLVAALFPQGHTLLNDLECNANLASQLAALPMQERIKKKPSEYQQREQEVADAWNTVRQRCSQAERFSLDLLEIFPP